MEDAIAGKHSELVGRLQAHLEVGLPFFSAPILLTIQFLGPLQSS